MSNDRLGLRSSRRVDDGRDHVVQIVQRDRSLRLLGNSRDLSDAVGGEITSGLAEAAAEVDLGGRTIHDGRERGTTDRLDLNVGDRKISRLGIRREVNLRNRAVHDRGERSSARILDLDIRHRIGEVSSLEVAGEVELDRLRARLRNERVKNRKTRSLKAAAKPAVVWNETATTNDQGKVTRILTGTKPDGSTVTVCPLYNGWEVPFEFRQKILTIPEEDRQYLVSMGPEKRTDMQGKGDTPNVPVPAETDTTQTDEIRIIDLRW